MARLKPCPDTNLGSKALRNFAPLHGRDVRAYIVAPPKCIDPSLGSFALRRIRCLRMTRGWERDAGASGFPRRNVSVRWGRCRPAPGDAPFPSAGKSRFLTAKAVRNDKGFGAYSARLKPCPDTVLPNFPDTNRAFGALPTPSQRTRRSGAPRIHGPTLTSQKARHASALREL
jgi:hypothetical protein